MLELLFVGDLAPLGPWFLRRGGASGLVAGESPSLPPGGDLAFLAGVSGA